MPAAMTKQIFFTLLMFATALSPAFSQPAITSSPTVTVEQGALEGLNDSGIYIFKGVPFAQPPVGDLRWKEPLDPLTWEGTREAKSFAPGCMQLPVFSDMNFRSEKFSENCLYLNVWTPAPDDTEQLPVLVYFYGGGFMAGDGSEPRYDGASMARNHGIVAVTVNYRLGVFGFFAHPELTEESGRQASGNYGLLDQAKALQWVKGNISAFGGDPDNITIAGESAGSVSVSAQMASPLSRNLISGAIGESGSILGALRAAPLGQVEKNGVQFAEILEKSSVRSLRSIPAEELLQATARPGLPRFSPAVDGYFFPEAPVEIFRAGRQADVPLLAGWNSQEMNYRAVLGNDAPTPETYAEKIRELYGEHAGTILELYPGSTTEEVLLSATDLAGDRFISFSTWKWIDTHSETGSNPVYRYYYTHPRPPEKSTKPNPEDSDPIPGPSGAVHSAEIEYMMGNLPSNGVFAWTEEDYKVSAIFQGYAANFIKHKNPNGPGLPRWNPVNGRNSSPVLFIGPETYLAEALHPERYEFLNSLAFPE